MYDGREAVVDQQGGASTFLIRGHKIHNSAIQ